MSPVGNSLTVLRHPSRLVPMVEASQVGEARRLAISLASEAGLNETLTGRAAIIATEVASNLVKHAKDGALVVQLAPDGRTSGVQIIGIDRGPGMDIERCLADGYSTAGSPGSGLGAIKRMASTLDIYSQPDAGTILFATVIQGRPKSAAVEFGAVCLALDQDYYSGDAWDLVEQKNRTLFLMADGLGHGVHAAQAAQTAIRVFREHSSAALPNLLQAIHPALRSTRGAAVAVLELSLEEQLVRFAGVGNISASIITAGTSRGLISHNGTLGHELVRVQEFVYPWPEHSLVVMHSDGLKTRWSLDAYPAILGHHPALIAALLYRDFRREKDDATVLVARRAS